MAKNVAFVPGAMGIVGKHVILELLSRPAEEWEVYAVSRRKPDFEVPRPFVHLELDLLGKIEDIAKKLQEKEGTSKITHIFFAAYQEKPTLKEQVGPNLAMLKNSVEAVEKVAPNLKHVSLIEGTKWYGVHLGASKTPQKEDDPRYMPPNFYYDQEDYLVSRVKDNGVKWSWSGLRPNPVCGIAFGNPMNLATGIAVYASICKELNIPFRYPGTEKGWRILLEVVDAGLLAKGLIWAATTPACANQAFNFSNGDIFRWCDVWGNFAKFFDLELADGPIMQINLADMMASNEDTWAQIRKKHPNLRDIPFKDLTMWPFIDWVFTREYDWFADVNKARRFGFHEMTLDSGEMFETLFKKMREERIIP